MTRNPPTKRGSPGKGQNKWTHEQRVCLDILFHHPDSPSSNERARAFNVIFKDHQAACGVIGGLAYKVLAIQYKESDYKHKSTWAKTWGPVRAVPRQDTDLRERLRDMIDQVLMSGDTIQVSAGPATPPTTPPGRSETTMASSGDDTGSRPVALPQRYRGSQLATPGPSTRKHPASTSEITLVVDEDEEDDDYQPGPKRARNARSPVVELPATPPESVALIRLHASASKKSAKSPQKSRVVGRGRPGADRPFLRPDGVTIMLKPKEYLETQQPLNIVSEEAAHPKTGPALVFRYWDEQSHGLNSPDGFLSGRSVGALVDLGAPPSTSPPCWSWNDFARHLNNAGMDQTGSPSPFMSTSNRLIDSMCRMLRKCDPTGHISIIDPSKLRFKNSLFYVKPLFKECKKLRCFTKGGFQYHGSHEHLVWDQIPAAAIVRSISITDLIAFANSSPTLSTVLRLEKLKVGTVKVAKDLKEDKIAIDSAVAEAMAQIVMFLGLDHNSSLETLTYAVSEIVQGWCLVANQTSQEKVGAFVQAFVQRSREYVDVVDHIMLKHAFYSGLQWSCGAWNARLKGPEEYARMQGHALKKGLVAPAEAITRELDALKLRAIVHKRIQDRLHATPLPIEGRAVIEEVEDDAEEEEAIVYDEEEEVVV